MVQFSDFRGSFAELPSGSLALEDVRTPEFRIYEDHRIVAYYVPFDYLNRLARVALVGVTPGPTQMRESYAIVRDALRAGLRIPTNPIAQSGVFGRGGSEAA
jgi:hypothetical protein